ncbi:hypothetical protein D9619_002393 [Psilocybe cf. subviscida]|uniref:Uncharacterized protein n=1 Tax=Psilocybe cf. subviscida TaxID=2480587 RepID=A0A8H5AW17_9AGAR|nr:hypothetical protein D9619_002393 [Psilocybe cf. subviscida]
MSEAQGPMGVTRQLNTTSHIARQGTLLTTMSSDERPLKRQRLDSPPTRSHLPIPADALLLALPSLLAHPPTHRNHAQSLVLSQLALRKYLTSPQLDSISEFRALVELAEIGFRIGLDEPGVESEVGRAISRALVIIAKHPSLRIHKVHLTTLSARLAAYQGSPKSTVNALKKLLTHFLAPSDPPHVVYAAHIAYITALATHVDAAGGDDAPGGRGSYLAMLRANGNTKALIAIRELGELAVRNGHREVVLLAQVLELRDLVHNGVWTRVGKKLEEAEEALGMFEDTQTPTPTLNSASGPTPISAPAPTTPPRNYTALEHVLRVHVAMAGALFHTYVGAHGDAQARIKQMHAMLDGEAFAGFGEHGIVEVQLPSTPRPSTYPNTHPSTHPNANSKADLKTDETPLRIQVTHPRTLLSIGFLVSSVAKRDPTGRKPKRRQFASEGVKVVDNELKKELSVPMWASIGDVHAFRERMNKIRADMICELVGVSIQRSEFDEAEHHISQLISHTRTHGLFATYSARLTLHQAHLAHALGRSERASRCYRVAAWLSRPRTTGESSSSSPSKKASRTHMHQEETGEDEDKDGAEEDDGQEDYWLNVSARAGDLWLRVGLAGLISDQDGWDRAMKPLREEGKAILQECEGLGGTLQAVGAVLGACLGEECLDVKTNLRAALTLCTTAEDNYLRPLVFALCADQYFHTAPAHAEVMLQTADGLAAGLGAQPKPKNAGGADKSAADKVGNAHLRMWIGERALELKRRKGEEDAVARQTVANEALRKAVARVEKRRFDEDVPVPVR